MKPVPKREPTPPRNTLPDWLLGLGVCLTTTLLYLRLSIPTVGMIDAGELLARGCPPAEVEGRIGQVVEGIPTTYALHDLSARLGVEMPVTANVYEALEHGKPPLECVRSLMSREPTTEQR